MSYNVNQYLGGIDGIEIGKGRPDNKSNIGQTCKRTQNYEELFFKSFTFIKKKNTAQKVENTKVQPLRRNFIHRF